MLIDNKGYRLTQSLLQNTGFFDSDVLNLRIESIVHQMAANPFLFMYLTRIFK